MALQNILVIKLRYLGDVLLATPMLHALKAAYPMARLSVLVNRGTEEILLRNPYVDEVMLLEKGSIAAQWSFASDLRRKRFDTVIDLTDADRSAFLTWMSRAPIRIGFNDERRWRGWCYTDVVRAEPASHRIERDLAALTPLGITVSDKLPRLWLSAEDEVRAEELLSRLGVQHGQLTVVIQPGARYWFKAWPHERFAELADRLTAEYQCQVLIGGSSQEIDLAQQIARAAKCHPVVLAGQVGIKPFAAILKRSALFVGNDSGAMHIATAVGTPVVALFGPSNPREWGPRGGACEVIYKELDCRACFHPACQRGEQNCMKLITIDEVCAAAGKLLAIKNHRGRLA